jgi:hypothetical protein
MPRPSRKVSSKAHTQSAVSGVIASSGGDRACDYPPPRMFYIKTAADPVVAAQASGISLPPPDKFVGLTMVPCGGMPHDPAEEDGAWLTGADEPITRGSGTVFWTPFTLCNSRKLDLLSVRNGVESRPGNRVSSVRFSSLRATDGGGQQ